MPKDFAAACGISVARARRLLKGGFIPNSLDLTAIARLLGCDSRSVIALREQHNLRYHRRKDRDTVWSVTLEEGTALNARSQAPLSTRSERLPISHATPRNMITGHLIFPSNPAMCEKRSSGGSTSAVRTG